MSQKQPSLFDQLLEQRLDRLPSFAPSAKQSTCRTGQLPRIQIDQPPSSELTEREEHPNPAFDCNRTLHHSLTMDGVKFWCQGTAVLCQCPACQAPMTARVFIGLADCWRCQTSIELTESQLKAIDELVQKQAAPLPTVAPASIPAASPTRAPVIIETHDEPVDERERELEALTRQSLTASLVRRSLQMTPAWLVSFLLHLIAILILAIIVLGNNSPFDQTIVLSSFLDSSRTPGGEIRVENPDDRVADDLLPPPDVDVRDPAMKAILKNAARDARELTNDPLPAVPLPDLETVRENITHRRSSNMSFAARDPRVRSEIVKQEGGTTLTEAAVARGLRWLASVQNRDGSWSLLRYEYSRRSNNKGDARGTSLALLPFLGAGQTHEFGKYKETVAKGLAWLINNQKRNGDLRINAMESNGIYAHAQATIVLCEALAMTGDEQFREPAQKAIQFIEDWQHREGGWRYRKRSAGDTSIHGWQMMALQSASAAKTGLNVDQATMRLADYYLDSAACRGKSKIGNRPYGSLYCYYPSGHTSDHLDPTPSMTAEALLCRMYLGWERNDPRLRAGIRWLNQNHFPDVDEKDVYYWYYGTQTMHHYGGEAWEKWNQQMRAILVATQKRRGKYAGSWEHEDDKWGERAGRIYTTALSICILEVYYRHLPLFDKPQ